MNLNLKGKNALVCGSSQGIGKAAAIELALLGANVTLLARNQEKLQQVKDELHTGEGQTHNYLVANFAYPHEVETAVTEYLEHGGDDFHILVNNTGGPPAGHAHEADIDAFRRAFESHLICNQVLVKALLPGMRAYGYGRIINIISTSVKQPLPNLGVSNTIRGAVANWSKTLANEVGPYHITVNNVLPGATATSRLDAIIKNKAEKQGVTETEAANTMKQGIPLRRFADPEDLGAAVAFLASPAAGYINGINLPVDGGRTGCL